ncbi:hypothetical protein LTR99_010837 [Exophiala xenobiotica]|uniref:Ketoreductase domain-containing protein n=1 Tax=Vermiconidia calcicola TaxID=1690605 RepID=A0AAV9PUG6_9PEZI|nr:hypothetical protein H2202_011092 [Exophiala xenobiotica]KAK5528100.1 hypothetical protein LTR25_010615 [Vermiconidia calcicola]KAK5533651.1 hypothetical protein LTR23_009132 [Chaetothyriales sp. CCFEE 6169]KAK5207720.1 hypothetical protein LTR41_006764 [Exophiala xenobiotica]KAK5220747.1 hypothetical protein LTR72_007369 [Exophiala xenobiotica]
MTELFSLTGKAAIVTGGTSGIGAAMALALAKAGADIILIQRNADNTTTYEAIKALGRGASIHTADLSDQKSVEAIMPALVAAGHNMHILLNCAGIQKRRPASQFPVDDWNSVLQVNLTSVFTLSRDFGAYLLSKHAESAGASASRGSIINIASLMSFTGGVSVPAYASSKGGLVQLTKALSNEWMSHGIRVNAIAPGFIDTNMTKDLQENDTTAKSILDRIPAGRWGKPEDFQGPAVFLASEASQYVSGAVILVDGGYLGR